jgi:FkbM family methyltransferase
MSKLYPLNIDGLPAAAAMYVHQQQTDTQVSRRIMAEGVWEPYETALIVERLQPGDTFVDVGANIGYYSVIASQLVGDQGRVYSFEPEPDNFALLAANTALCSNDNVTTVNAALAAEPGQGFLYLNTENRGDHQIYDDGEGRQKTAIELLHGDSFFQALATDTTIDILKVDTQGAEIAVLTGLDQTVRNSLGQITLIIEFWPRGLRMAGGDANDLLDWMMSLNLPMFNIDHINHQLLPMTEAELRSWINLLSTYPDDDGFFNILLGS